MKLPPGGGLHPAVGMHSEGEEVQLHLDADWVNEESMLMAVDHCEDDWKRLHDIRLCGQVGMNIHYNYVYICAVEPHCGNGLHKLSFVCSKALRGLGHSCSKSPLWGLHFVCGLRGVGV